MQLIPRCMFTDLFNPDLFNSMIIPNHPIRLIGIREVFKKQFPNTDPTAATFFVQISPMNHRQESAKSLPPNLC